MKTKNKKKNKLIIITISVIIILALVILLIASFIPKKSGVYNFNKEVTVGIDVSEYNGDIEWDKVKTQVDYAFVRVGYRGYSNGNLAFDKSYQDNLSGANQNNLPIGIYFYSQATTVDEAKEEAEFVLNAVKSYKIDLPVVIDYEYAYDNDGKEIGRLYDARLSKKQSTQIIKEFCETVEKAGYTSGVYASSSLYYTAIDTKKLPNNTLIWVADYNDNLTYVGKYNVWQYTKRGKCDGINSKYVDMNYWYE